MLCTAFRAFSLQYRLATGGSLLRPWWGWPVAARLGRRFKGEIFLRQSQNGAFIKQEGDIQRGRGYCPSSPASQAGKTPRDLG